MNRLPRRLTEQDILSHLATSRSSIGVKQQTDYGDILKNIRNESHCIVKLSQKNLNNLTGKFNILFMAPADVKVYGSNAEIITIEEAKELVERPECMATARIKAILELV